MIVFLIDADNLSSPEWVDEACKRLEAGEGRISVLRAYGSSENLRGLTDAFRDWPIRQFPNLSLSKNTTDIALAVDAMELACRVPTPTVVAIGSGDADFLPLAVRLRERGIRMVCVSERGKMAQEAAHIYDRIVYVGGDIEFGRQLASANANAPAPVLASVATIKQTAARKAPAKHTVPDPAPAKKPATKKAPAKKVLATPTTVTVNQILAAAPALNSGELQRLAEVSKQLHDAKLIGKNTSSTKVFKRHPQHFELTPARQPNQVRFIALRQGRP